MSSNNETAEEKRRLIDLEISKHESHIRELKFRRNALSPIFRLPPEIFCQIFEFAREDNGHRPLLWIKLTHVSRHWWNVAVSCPGLWTNLPLSHPHWTDEMLKRSKMASLILIADFASPLKLHEEAIRKALTHMSRVKDLTFFRLRHGNTVQKLVPDFPKSAPRLESLRICVRPSNILFGMHDMSDILTITLHKDFLCDTPNLRRLELARVDVCWDSQLLSSLTHLTLHDVSPTGRPTSTQFLDMLRRMPALQLLCISACLPRHESTANSTVTSLNKPIHFAHLQTLDISDIASSITSLLQVISTPPSVRIKLFCLGSVAAKYAGLLSALSTIRSTPDTKPILTLDFRLPGHALVIRAFPRVLTAMEIWGQSSQPNLELMLNWRLGSEVNKAIGKLFNALPLTDLVNLAIRFSESDRPYVANIRDTFGQLPRLRSVHCSGSTGSFFLEVLMVQVTSTSPSPIIVFPGLRTLTLEDATFNDDKIGSIDVESLCDCLVERYERGLEVRKLSLEDCYRLRKDDVDRLRELVVDVEWDAIEQGFIEEEDEYEPGFFDNGHYHESDSDY